MPSPRPKLARKPASGASEIYLWAAALFGLNLHKSYSVDAHPCALGTDFSTVVEKTRHDSVRPSRTIYYLFLEFIFKTQIQIYRFTDLGSIASCSPSPMKLKLTTVIQISSPGKIAIHTLL